MDMNIFNNKKANSEKSHFKLSKISQTTKYSNLKGLS